MKEVKGFYIKEGLYQPLKYYCPYCNDIFGVFGDRCKHYISHRVTPDRQSIFLLEEKNEIIFQIEKLAADIKEQADKEQSSCYLISLIERLQDLVSFIEEDICTTK